MIMKTKRLSVILWCIMLLPAVNIITAQTSDAELKKKIEKINVELAAAMMAGNMEKSLSYYAADVISMPNNSPMIEGVDAVKKSNEQMMNSGVKINSCEFTTKRVSSYGKLITEVGTYKMKFTMPDAKEAMEDQGKYLNVWEKQSDGSLKIKIEIWNTDTSYEM